MLRATDVRVRFGAHDALAGVELTARPGRVLGLIGPNGSGKTTLLRAFLRAIDAEGHLAVDDDDVRRLATRELARRIAIVSQHEQTHAELSVLDLVLLGRSVHVPGWASYRDRDRELAEAAMRRTGVWSLRDRPLSALSGGERQRMLIARAVAQESPHLLLDEPTNHLDVRYQHEVLALVRGLELVTVVVLHDLNLAARYCDDLVLLERGRVVAAGGVREVLTPRLVERVYGVAARAFEVDGVHQLVFSLVAPHVAQFAG